MKVLLTICLGAIFLAIGSCEGPIPEPSGKAAPTPEGRQRTDCDWKGDVLDINNAGLQKFLVGKWEGRRSPNMDPSMHLTFTEDGTAIVDYSIKYPEIAEGGITNHPYRISDEKTLNICGYPDNFTIVKFAEDEFRLQSDIKSMAGAVEVIYDCTFRRVEK